MGFFYRAVTAVTEQQNKKRKKRGANEKERLFYNKFITKRILNESQISSIMTKVT